jgi:CO/xanthine dehydrogenase FAD-binding subunit
LPELTGVKMDGADLILGAGLTFAQCQEHPLLLERLPILAEAARTVGSLQIRNVATLGGNVGNFSPAGDGVTALVGLGAFARLAKLGQAREVLLERLVAGKDLRFGEILVSFRLPAPAQPRAAAFRKVIRRQAVGIARFNLAVQLGRDEQGGVDQACLGVGAVFPSPRRLREVENLLQGGKPGPALWVQASQLVARLMLDTCGSRPSMAYKEPALARVTAATLALAWQRGGLS